jgi:hypothetical protein
MGANKGPVLLGQNAFMCENLSHKTFSEIHLFVFVEVGVHVIQVNETEQQRN